MRVTGMEKFRLTGWRADGDAVFPAGGVLRASPDAAYSGMREEAGAVRVCPGFDGGFGEGGFRRPGKRLCDGWGLDCCLCRFRL